MAISDTQKVDYLWKKIGYGISKTDTDVGKKAYEETIASPLLLRGDLIWQRSIDIPGTLPTANTSIITVYKDGSGSWSGTVECTEDTTSTDNKSWKTNLANWIGVEFGATYQVQVYIATSGVNNPQTSGSKIFAAGSGNNDEWFFDYQSGVLHFIGANLPAAIATGITGKSIYVSGARYTGPIGFNVSSSDSSDTQVLYNNNGNFAGSSSFTFNNSTNTLNAATITRDNKNIITFVSASTKPSNPKLGDSWYNTTNDKTYQYIYDGVTHNWIDISSGSMMASVEASPSSLVNRDANANIYANNFIGNTITIAGTGISNIGNVGNLRITGGTSGYVLRTDGAGNLSWINPSSTVAGSDTQILFNDGGAANGNSSFTFNKITGMLTAGNITTVNDVVVNGNLTVNGLAEYFNVISTVVKDPIIEVGGGANADALTTNDSKDRGTLLHYYTTKVVDAFMGWDNSNAEFAFGSNVTTSGEVVTFNTFGNVRAGYFIGDGSQLTSITGTNITGQVGNALVAGTVYANAQPNITSVGTLTSLTVTANVSAGNVLTNNLYYANGVAWDLQQAAGSDTELQFNTGNDFGASANLTFNSTTNTLSANKVNVTEGPLTINGSTISVTSGVSAGIFNVGTPNISMGALSSNVTIGSSTGNVTLKGTVNISELSSNRASIAVTTDTLIDSFLVTKYRTAKYLISAESSAGYESVEVLLIHDGTNSYITTYGAISSVGYDDMITLTSNVNGGNVCLYASNVYSSTNVNLLSTYVKV